MNPEELDRIATLVAEKVEENLMSDGVNLHQDGDLSIAQIQKILGVGNSSAYSVKYHGEYQLNGRRLVRREEFMYRRRQGLDVCITD